MRLEGQLERARLASKYWYHLCYAKLTCRVKFAVNTETGDRVAIKILDKQKIIRQGMAEQIKKEVNHVFVLPLTNIQ